MSKPKGTKNYAYVDLDSLKSIASNPVVPVSLAWVKKYNEAATMFGAKPIEYVDSANSDAEAAAPSSGGIGAVDIG